jgi:hypothetical protein
LTPAAIYRPSTIDYFNHPAGALPRVCGSVGALDGSAILLVVGREPEPTEVFCMGVDDLPVAPDFLNMG